MRFSLIAAVDQKMGIGKNGHLPWKLPSDLKYFDKTSRGNGENVVIMGRGTWESLPQKPLKERTNIIITRNREYQVPDGVIKTFSLEEALVRAADRRPEEIFVIGGAQIFREAISRPDCTMLYITEVQGVFDSDTFFPPIDPKHFKKTYASETHEENGIKFQFARYSRQ